VLSHDQVSALVTLYSHLGDVNTAVEVLDDAVEHAQKNKVSRFDSYTLPLEIVLI